MVLHRCMIILAQWQDSKLLWKGKLYFSDVRRGFIVMPAKKNTGLKELGSIFGIKYKDGYTILT